MRCHALLLGLLLPIACAGDDEATTGDSTSSTSTTSTTSDSTSTGEDSGSTSEAGPVCGDGILEAPEVCDDGKETVNCDGDCSGPAVCGDGYLNTAAGEKCDDGNASNKDACLDDCTKNVCGDGFKHQGVEECDDGNKNDMDGCSSDCKAEHWCGDGTDDPGEYCDQGGVNTEACDEDCTIPKCGDGLLNEAAGEECDDNNYASEDGCSKECVVEYCGDGVVQEGLGEECEDGNDVDFDGCSAECKVDKPCGEGFTTTWCQQAGLELDQYTRCESVSDDQATCFNPEIRYGTNEGGIPIWAGSDEYMDESLAQWCASLGFAGLDVYEKGDRDCLQPYGAVVWSTGGDEAEKHWRDAYSDAKWYPPEKLNEANEECPGGHALTSVRCQ